ncbi:MAG: hypothetical protein JRJ66_14830 [Deltaproteobacteria bacterium]|nr:hypothetical protein [Deltaproteobacteria bacterium]MBW2301672.1 hypothetical protein [Deltaproteobacteria bacterium]
MSDKADPSLELFQNYARHYASLEERARGERLPEELERLKRHRLPSWIDEIPKDARILDAPCAYKGFECRGGSARLTLAPPRRACSALASKATGMPSWRWCDWLLPASLTPPLVTFSTNPVACWREYGVRMGRCQ